MSEPKDIYEPDPACAVPGQITKLSNAYALKTSNGYFEIMGWEQGDDHGWYARYRRVVEAAHATKKSMLAEMPRLADQVIQAHFNRSGKDTAFSRILRGEK